jgi:hypothetical protein
MFRYCVMQITKWCGVCPAHLPEEQGPPWVLLAEPPHDEQGTLCWARAPRAFAPSSVNCSMAGRTNDAAAAAAAAGVGDDMSWGPVGGRYLRRSSSSSNGRRWVTTWQQWQLTLAVAMLMQNCALRHSAVTVHVAVMFCAYTCTHLYTLPGCPCACTCRISNAVGDPASRWHSSSSSVRAGPCTPSAASAPGFSTPTGWLGSNSGVSGAPMLSSKSFTGRKLGRSSLTTMNPVPDMSALYTMRRVAAEQATDSDSVTSNSSSGKAGGRSSVRHSGTGAAVGVGPAASPANGPGAAGSTPRGGSGGGAAGKAAKKDRGSRGASSSLHGLRRFSAGCDIDCGLAAALYARLVLHKWSWADTLMVHVSGC